MLYRGNGFKHLSVWVFMHQRREELISYKFNDRWLMIGGMVNNHFWLRSVIHE